LQPPRILKSGRIGNVSVTVVEDAEKMGCYVGDLIADELNRRSNLILGLCTGGTPVPVYNHLVHLFTQRTLSFAAAKTFNLDEYYPMTAADPHSYRSFMNTQLFDLIDIAPKNVHIPSGQAPDPHAEAANYESLIRQSGGIDLQLLGLGHNTHIGFNEPPSNPASRTRLVTLSEDTCAANARFFDSPADVPRQSITMGLGTILEARSIILCAFGSDKAQAVHATLCGTISESAPGSFLQQHPHTIAVLDRDAAALLPLEPSN
jgi:glucosamine-6-phosphate deaminase